jgi:hypothetical protein
MGFFTYKKSDEMNNLHEKLVQDVVKSINWNRIKYFHHVFGIKWQFQEKEGYIAERFPTVSDLKEELRTLLKFAVSKNTPVLEYGNWLILWTDEDMAKKQGSEGARLEAIFSLEDSIAIDTPEKNSEDVENLRDKLEEAVTKEDYEKAAKLRDRLAVLEKSLHEHRKKYDAN